jgi:hypothetical protein
MGFKKTEIKAHNFALITNLVKEANQVSAGGYFSTLVS